MQGNGGKCKEGSESVKACLDLLGGRVLGAFVLRGGAWGAFSRYEMGGGSLWMRNCGRFARGKGVGWLGSLWGGLRKWRGR